MCIRDRLEGFVYRTVQFEFEYVDVVGCFYHCIRTPSGTANFSFYILPQQFEDQIEDYLVMLFGPVVQFIGKMCIRDRTGSSPVVAPFPQPSTVMLDRVNSLPLSLAV